MKRFLLRGGNYNNTSNAGPKNCNANNRRSSTYVFGLGFIESQFLAAQGRQVRAIDKKSPIPSPGGENSNGCTRPVGFARPPWCTTFAMKTYNNIWNNIIDFESLFRAYRRAARYKKYHSEVLAFSQNLEENLIQLQNELIWHEYMPAPPRQFMVYEPKKRIITAPAFRDRIVHHAICNEIEPLIDKRFVYDTYACRVGKGPQKAVARLQYFEREAAAEWREYWAYKGDIKSFFLSIVHEVLKELLQHIISDENVLNLIYRFIDSYGPIGLPIGALLSQLLANLYLNPLDHFVKENLRCRYYVRYMDDFVILTKTKDDARCVGDEITAFVEYALGLTMNPKSSVVKGRNGVHFCGCRIWPDHILPVRESFRRSVRHLKKLAKLYNDGDITLDRYKASLASFLGHYSRLDASRSIDSAMDKIILGGIHNE